jgi:hypothetical protein
MKRIVNVPLAKPNARPNVSNNASLTPSTPTANIANIENAANLVETPKTNFTPFTSRVNSQEEALTPRELELEPMTLAVNAKANVNTNVRNGKAYIPTPMVAPQKGGRSTSRIPMPKKLLGGISRLFKKFSSRKSRKSRK